MQTTDSKVLDFNRFKQERSLAEAENSNSGFTPTLIWYPVWVLVPNSPQTPSPASN